MEEFIGAFDWLSSLPHKVKVVVGGMCQRVVSNVVEAALRVLQVPRHDSRVEEILN